MIFDAFGAYDLARLIGVVIGFSAGVVQILFGGPGRLKLDLRPLLATR